MVVSGALNLSVGDLFGRVMSETPLLAIGLSVVVVITLGITVDLIVQRVAALRASRASVER